MPNPVYDMSPTATGHEWYCNACTFHTPNYEEAIQHAIWGRDKAPYIHILYERTAPFTPEDKGVKGMRRIAPEASGTVNTIRRPTRAKKKPRDNS